MNSALALIKNRLNDKCMFNKNKRIRCQTNNNQQHAICVFCLSHWTRHKKKEKWMNEWPYEKWLLMKFQTYYDSFFYCLFRSLFQLLSFCTHRFFFYVSNATTLHSGQLLVTNSIWVTFSNISTHCAALASGRKFSSALGSIKTFETKIHAHFPSVCVLFW